MSLRSFTVLALSLRKRDDLDLRPVRIHSHCRTRSFAFHLVAQEADLRIELASGQRCERLPSVVHPLPAGQRRVRGATARGLRRAGCESYASPSRHLKTDVSVERHLSRIFPCLTRSLARCLSRALRQLRGSAFSEAHHALGPARLCARWFRRGRVTPSRLFRGEAFVSPAFLSKCRPLRGGGKDHR
jgi:hypothetical protein